MVSTALPAWLARRNIHYGWVIVGVTLLTTVITAAAMSTPGVLIVPLEKEFGWTDAQISSALALRLMLFGLFGPFAAAFMNRYGVRAVMVSAVILISAGFLASLVMTQVWQLVLLWGIVVGVGTGLTAMVLAVTVATRWFNAPPRPGHGHFCRQQCHRAADLSAADRLARHPLRLAHVAGLYLLPAGACRCRRAAADARPAERRRSAALWRNHSRAAARRRCRPGLAFAVAAHRAAGRRARADLLGAVRHVLRLRLQHQRPDPDPFRHAVPRLRARRHDGGERAGDDGLFRFLRHHRLGLAVRPLRSALAAVLVLRPARPVAALSAVHRFHLLRPVAVRGVLRPRLDRDRAADGEAHRRPLRPRARRHRVRLDIRRPSDRRRQRGVRRRSGADRVFDLPAGVLRRRRALHHRGVGGDLGAQAVGAGWSARLRRRRAR